MVTKRCTGPCGKDLPEEDFHWKNKARGQRISKCRLCWSEYSKEHYRLNKTSYVRKARKWEEKSKEEVFQKVMAYLAEHPCVDCGEGDVVVLTFDHVRGKKRAHVSHLIARASWTAVEAEIAKCEVRCANCHTRRTAKQFGWKKFAVVALVGVHLHGKQT
jgi:hypothetical protein